ncbi:hypothetical protein NO221_02920 [Gluconacetobacter entanii]|nr:hypothetical protein [Gluconacetobacter entanii]MCW4579357.1 hypothetical protein [Gluconacetobacter entanii]MCW4582763.1 hypothetical protein [Gluconacetobacter entanii]MCW4586177.1 hypothetical protein [Gluconacetobacter entanii]
MKHQSDAIHADALLRGIISMFGGTDDNIRDLRTSRDGKAVHDDGGYIFWLEQCNVCAGAPFVPQDLGLHGGCRPPGIDIQDTDAASPVPLPEICNFLREFMFAGCIGILCDTGAQGRCRIDEYNLSPCRAERRQQQFRKVNRRMNIDGMEQSSDIRRDIGKFSGVKHASGMNQDIKGPETVRKSR